MHNRLYIEFLSNETHVEDLRQYIPSFPHESDPRIYEQGRRDFHSRPLASSIVSTQLPNWLIQKGHIHTVKNWEVVQRATEIVLDA